MFNILKSDKGKKTQKVSRLDICYLCYVNIYLGNMLQKVGILSNKLRVFLHRTSVEPDFATT